MGPWLKNKYKGSEVSGIGRSTKGRPGRQSRGKHQDSRENKTNCFPRDHTLSVYYTTSPYMWKNHFYLISMITTFQSIHQIPFKFASKLLLQNDLICINLILN